MNMNMANNKSKSAKTQTSKVEARKIRAKGAVEAAIGAGKVATNVGTAIATKTVTPSKVAGTINGAKQFVSGIKKLIKNDPSWYEHYPLDGLVNLNFGRKKGVYEPALNPFYKTYNLSDITTNIAAAEVKYGVGNIWAFDTRLTVPKGLGHASWTMGIKYLYSTIRAANSGAVNYTEYDLERYILSARALHAAYADMKRAYKMLNTIESTDTTTPASYFAALGKDYATFKENGADLKQRLNQYSLVINKLVPLKIDLFTRTRWLFSNLFMDSNDAKAAPYCFTLKWVHYFITSDNNQHQCQCGNFGTTATSTGLDYTQYVLNIRQMFGTITADQKFAIIAGDIMKAFGPDAIYPTEIVGELDKVDMVYDENILAQIENATVLGGHNVSNWTVTANDWLVQNIGKTDYAHGRTMVLKLNECFGKSVYVNSPKNVITPGEALEYTRFCVSREWSITDPSDNTNHKASWVVTECGTEYIGQQVVFYVSSGDPSVYHGIHMNGGIDPGTLIPTNFADVVNANWQYYTRSPHTFWSQFDHAPMMWDGRVYEFETVPGSPSQMQTVTVDTILWDFNNYAVIDDATNGQFHGYAAMSLLAAPRLLKQSNAVVID